MQAAIWRPFMIPPAASTGTSRIFLIACSTSGTSTMVVTSPQWPPASVPCTTRMSTPALTWRMACSLAPTRAATGTPWRRPISIIAGGAPSALAIILIGCSNAASMVRIACSGSNGWARSSETCCSSISTPAEARRLAAKSWCSCGMRVFSEL